MYAENLKKIRAQKKYSLGELADILEIPARTPGAYERNERTCSLELVARLCNNLNINANWFITGKGNMFNPPKFEDVEDEFTQKVEAILRKHKIVL